MPILLLVMSLCLSVPAWADDLGMAGALSGAGQGFGRGLESMQSAIIQQGLAEEQGRRQLEQQRRQQEHELQMREMEFQHKLKMQRLEREAQERRVAPPAQHVAVETEQEHPEIEKLNGLRPDWRQIVGAEGSDTLYRQWLRRQPKAYQRRIDTSVNAEEINESIGEFLDTRR